MYDLFIQSGEIFLHLLNMSIAASWLVLVIVLVRLVFKKSPKWVNCLLWGLVAIRLLVPFNIESEFSLVPSGETMPVGEIYNFSEQVGDEVFSPQVNSGIEVVDSVLQPALNETSAQPVLQSNISIVACVWLAGIVAMLIYSLISYLKVRKSVREAMHVQENIFLCDNISTPFILGIIRPKIYLPSSLYRDDVLYVIDHEKAHIKRLDHLWKPLGFLILSVYWFNPAMWIAYILLCKDIELACDEKVIKELDAECKKEYSTALINCSSQRRLVSACPLAFGETGVKNRIKSVLSYKKPAFWVIIISVALCIVIAAGFLTSPLKKKDSPKNTPDTTQITKAESTTTATVVEGTTASHENKGENTTNSVNKPVEETKKLQTTTKPQATTEPQETNTGHDFNRNGVLDRGEYVDFLEPLPDSMLNFGPPEYELNCDGVVYANVVTNFLYDELEGKRSEYSEKVTDKNKIQAFTDKFNSLLKTSTPDELDTWWNDDNGGDENIKIYLYKADGSCITVASVDPWRIRLENHDRRKISPYDRKALLDCLFDKDASEVRWWSNGTYKVDMSDEEFVEKAKTVTKDDDWLTFKDIFGETGGFDCNEGYDRSHISNGEYVLFVDEGYQVYLRKVSEPDYRLQID